MSRSLNYRTLCNLYTLEQIQEKVTYYQEIIDATAGNKMYHKDSQQGSQRVENQDIQNVVPLLESWLKALECKQGMGGVNIVSGNFGGHC